jgi:SAM-dependent methyltransferase
MSRDDSSPKTNRGIGEKTLPYLNLGCGTTFDLGWVNMDLLPSNPEVIAHDLYDPLPFGDGTFEMVYHSHVLEHLHRGHVRDFLLECRRVLKPGGTVRIVVPDLERLAKSYLACLEGALAGDPDDARRYDWTVIELLDQMTRQSADGGEMFFYLLEAEGPDLEFAVERLAFEVLSKLAEIKAYRKREGWYEHYLTCRREWRKRTTAEEVGRYRLSGEAHLWMYDRHSLAALLKDVGFRDPIQRDSQTSGFENFREFHLDANEKGETRKPDSLFMEACNPA